MPNETSSHYLIGHYTTHQPDGVHIEAHWTCGVKLEGVENDESIAAEPLWAMFIEHTRDQIGYDAS